MKRLILFALACVLSVSMVMGQTPAKSQVKKSPEKPADRPSLTIDTIIQLHRSGVSEEVIIAKIKQNNKPFDLSAEEILKLKEAKVSDRVVRLLMDPSMDMTLESKPAQAPAPAAPTMSPAPPAPSAPATYRRFTVSQGEQELKLVPKSLATSFIKSDAKIADQVIESAVMSSAMDLGIRGAM